MHIFIFLFSLLMIGSTQATEGVFDPEYVTKITKCKSYIYSPSTTDDDWLSVHCIHFDNGLSGTKSRHWKNKSQAKEWAKITYEGIVNIIPSRLQLGSSLIALIQEEGSTSSFLDDLYINADSVEHPLHIQTLTENIETISGWFYNKFLYRYVMTLDDGTTWVTKAQSSPWIYPWQEGERIVKIGSSTSPYLINADELLRESSQVIHTKNKHYLCDLERAD